MKKIFLVLISSITFLAFSNSANAIKVGALYLDTAGFFGEIKYGIESAGADEGIELTGANSQSDVAKESEFIDTLIAKGVDVVVMSPVSTDSSVDSRLFSNSAIFFSCLSIKLIYNSLLFIYML